MNIDEIRALSDAKTRENLEAQRKAREAEVAASQARVLANQEYARTAGLQKAKTAIETAAAKGERSVSYVCDSYESRGIICDLLATEGFKVVEDSCHHQSYHDPDGNYSHDAYTDWMLQISW